MSEPAPRILKAGVREAGARCASCGGTIELGDPTALCGRCGEVYHEACWEALGRCTSYECAGESAEARGGAAPTISVTASDLAAAEPLPSRQSTQNDRVQIRSESKHRWNKTSIWAFVVSLLGCIPLFGLITGARGDRSGLHCPGGAFPGAPRHRAGYRRDADRPGGGHSAGHSASPTTWAVTKPRFR